MKDAEDEAFDEIARKQGAWGGGFKAKQAMAADKVQDETDMLTIAYLDGYERGKKAALAQPAQEPVAVDCCANCLRPKNEHQGIVCPKPYTTNWNAWDYPFAPDTTPPQREWVELTDEEIDEGNKQSWVNKQAWESAVWWASEKLKEKNNGL